MVRLLPATATEKDVGTGKFQSHNGAIAAEPISVFFQSQRYVSIPQWCDCCRNLSEFYSVSKARFNPTMVRLLLLRGKAKMTYCVSFNPTMVRLLQKIPATAYDAVDRFQSHNGAIAAILDAVDAVLDELGFNPTMVRLLQNPKRRVIRMTAGFNPTMVRLLPADKN